MHYDWTYVGKWLPRCTNGTFIKVCSKIAELSATTHSHSYYMTKWTGNVHFVHFDPSVWFSCTEDKKYTHFKTTW